MIDVEEIEDKYICYECIGDSFLGNEVKSKSIQQKCSYCEKTTESISLEDLADKVKYVLDNFHTRTSTEPTDLEYGMIKNFNHDWERHGENIIYVIQEFLSADESIAKDIQKYLYVNDYSKIEEYYEEGAYDENSHYQEANLEDKIFGTLWDEFKTELKTKNRFFSTRAKEILDEIFSDIHKHATYKNKTAVNNMRISTLYRARVAKDFDCLSTILKNPIVELAPPPPAISKNGRMNPTGISVFYGVLETDTCIAEVRPPVGSKVVIGGFKLEKDVRILNLETLTERHVKESMFSSEYSKSSSLTVFFKNLVDDLCKPVTDDNENLEYLPSQVVAEYLANMVNPKIDGILFKSTQYETGTNIVLFNHAISVMPCKMPKDKDVIVEYAYDGNPEDNITCINVFDKTPSKSKIIETDEVKDTMKYTLKLDLKDIKVLRIESVKFISSNEKVNRYSFDIETCTDF